MSLLRRHKILLVCLFVFLIFGLLLSWFLFIPPYRISSDKVVTIKKGMSVRTISAMLEQEGIIRNKEFFIGMATLLGKTGEIKAGEYEFHPRTLPVEVLDSLVKGQVKRHLVTIPEGYTLSQIGQLLEDLNIVGKGAFLQMASSSAFIPSLGLFPLLSNQGLDSSKNKSGLTLEGYLFPDTYHFIKEMAPEEVIRTMVHRFLKVFGPGLIERTSHLGMAPRDVVILASIIEKESPLPEEKPLISAVFHNRLRIKMPLQSDPTVIYGIRDFDGNLTKEHLLAPTPFNTYLFVGLPPTPICNPGKESLWAALHPDSVSYLYFVSKNDGAHHFSENFEEHQRAVAKYQKISIRKN
jgi:UPF0755 protein